MITITTIIIITTTNTNTIINYIKKSTDRTLANSTNSAELALEQSQSQSHGYKSGLDRTKGQGLISTHGLEEVPVIETPLFMSITNNSRHSINVPLSSSQDSNLWSTSSFQDLAESEIQRPSVPSTTPYTTTPQLSPQTSKHSREEDDNVSERAFDISILEPPSKRHRVRLKPCRILKPDDEATINFPTTLQSPRSPLFTTHKLKRPHSSPRSPNMEDTTAMSKPELGDSGMTTLKLAHGNILGNNSNPPGLSFGPTPNSEQHRRPVSPELTTSPQEGSLVYKVGILELLEQDDRPTFIIDVADQENYIPGGRLRVEYANASLRAINPLLGKVAGYANLSSPTIVTQAFPEFKAWVLSFVSKQHESLDICLPSFLYEDFTWSCSTLRKRLRVINGIRTQLPTTNSTSSNTANDSPVQNRGFGQDVSSSTELFSEQSDYFGNFPPLVSDSSSTDTLMVRNQVPHIDGSSFDWTRLPLSAALPRHVQFTRNINWSATPLGPMKTWTFDLRAMCNLIMGSPHPAAMYWGVDYTAIYNEAYILLAGQKHPSLMGQSYKTAWAEIWGDIEGVFAKARSSGQATMKDDDRLFIKRNGYLEECYFAWSIIPLVGEDGSVVGLYNPAWEKTRRVISERRMLTLREVGEKTATARNIQGFWAQVIRALEYNSFDIPFAFLYSVNEDVDSDMSSQRSLNSGSLSQTSCCVLEGTIGVPIGHRSAATPLDLYFSEEGFAPYLRESMKLDRPVLLTTEEGTLPTELIEGLKCVGFGDPCRAAVVMPLHATSRESILGFLVMGVNPRRPYDDDYSLFVELMSRQLTTSMASVVLYEEEIRKGQKAARIAAQDRQELSELVNLRTQEAVESESRFTRMAEMAPVGMFIANSHGEITFSNDAWWEISRHPRSDTSAKSWMDSIKDEDRQGVQATWNRLVTQKVNVTKEFRFKTPWQSKHALTDTWALMNCTSLRDGDNNLMSIFGSITDISHQKWAEEFQKRKTEEAIELKRQQENFIDMTSHEMRNPLSAILQCSDEITSALTSPSLKGLRSSMQNAETCQEISEILESSIDAAQTIALCAQHQKRIVDDILTLSKLDSALLVVAPVSTQPVSVARRAIKMFEGDMEKHDISIEFQIQESYSDLDINWVKLDPSRLLQVLINLLTNAIKFTTGQPQRSIIVSIGATKEIPAGKDSAVQYIPSRSGAADLATDEAEWGTGENLYLKFAVQDTGRGLDEKEVSILFQRFSQASPRTHVQYGGSGLGLFISRELTELQGGQIGVSSEKGVGSCFAFYVKARRAERTPNTSPLSTPIHSAINRRPSPRTATPAKVESTNGSSKIPVHTQSTSETSTSSPEISPSPKVDYKNITILIVEDNLVNQRVLQKQLHRAGFVTEVSNHGLEALHKLEASSFWKHEESSGDKTNISCVLMDLEMPIMDGLTCTKKIRALEADGTIVRHVPIIAVTANARLEQIETAIATGMDDVVSKPFRIPDLIPKVEALVAKSRAASNSET
ncbi:M4R8, histidine kinase-group XI protein [Sclerotinia borealis F-4128]|uniref:M4R8, histidine kinase-group XI protein n=1 Tax=Sclerotinia borealis (strain F-4128) TaxID=1432307 RepID=W9CMV6_SCLBF|nr:M4R8, histidine kinase-group XI protein [Sclerotinia borealis F-4128]